MQDKIPELLSLVERAEKIEHMEVAYEKLLEIESQINDFVLQDERWWWGAFAYGDLNVEVDLQTKDFCERMLGRTQYDKHPLTIDPALALKAW